MVKLSYFQEKIQQSADKKTISVQCSELKCLLRVCLMIFDFISAARMAKFYESDTKEYSILPADVVLHISALDDIKSSSNIVVSIVFVKAVCSFITDGLAAIAVYLGNNPNCDEKLRNIHSKISASVKVA